MSRARAPSTPWLSHFSYLKDLPQTTQPHQYPRTSWCSRSLDALVHTDLFITWTSRCSLPWLLICPIMCCLNTVILSAYKRANITRPYQPVGIQMRPVVFPCPDGSSHFWKFLVSQVCSQPVPHILLSRPPWWLLPESHLVEVLHCSSPCENIDSSQELSNSYNLVVPKVTTTPHLVVVQAEVQRWLLSQTLNLTLFP